MGISRRTPTQGRAHETVHVILEATAQVLVEDGYARLSTNRVAKRAGVSIGTLYQYFGDKDALVAELAQRVAEAQVTELLAHLGQIDDQPLEEAVRSLILGLFAAKRVKVDMSQALARQVPRVGDLDAEQQVLTRITDVVSATLRRRRDVRPLDVSLASFALVRATFGVVQHALAYRPELVADDALAESSWSSALATCVRDPQWLTLR